MFQEEGIVRRKRKGGGMHGCHSERADLSGCHEGDHDPIIPCSRSLEDLGESKEVGALHKTAQDQGPPKQPSIRI